jgi:hypothetical protein
MTSSEKIVREDWEEVYSVRPVSEVYDDDHAMFQKDAKYYQTFGGGPEGGYFVTSEDWGSKVYGVRRGWGEPFTLKPLKGVRDEIVLEYEPADEMKGKRARCRLVETYSLKETRKIVDAHTLWGASIEIVKGLRDGLGRAGDAHYKDLCLGIVLFYFKELDKYLDLLPPDSCPSYKDVLHSLKTDESDDESSESEEEDSDSEEDLELQEAYSQIHRCEECSKPTEKVYQKCDGKETQDILFVCKDCEQKKI